MEKPMKKRLNLRFQTRIDLGDHIETYEFTAKGELYTKNGQTYVRFKEKLSETDEVQTTMKWDGKALLLIRQGVILMRQSFLADEETYGRYVTPEASWETVAQTKQLDVRLADDGTSGEIKLVYHFYLQGQDTGTHDLLLTFEEETAE